MKSSSLSSPTVQLPLIAADVHWGGDQSLSWLWGHISFSLFLSLIPATGVMCCLAQNCVLLPSPLDVTLIQEYTLTITSYKHSTLSPSYSLLFINHFNWAAVLWIEENTGHTRAVIPVASPKLTRSTGSFWDPTVPKRPRRVRPSFGQPPKIMEEEGLKERVRGICPCRKITFLKQFWACAHVNDKSWIQWGVVWRTVVFMARFLLHIISVS